MLIEHERAVRVEKVLKTCVDMNLPMGDVADVLSAAYVTVVAVAASNPAEAKQTIQNFYENSMKAIVGLWIQTDRRNNPDHYKEI